MILSLMVSLTSFLLGGFAVDGISDESVGKLSDNSTTQTRHLRVELEGQLPSIFVLGAQKGGSLSLLDLMTQHPLLCRGAHREPHFFSIDENYEEGSKTYKNYFKDAKCGKNLKTSKRKTEKIKEIMILLYRQLQLYDILILFFTFSIIQYDIIKS